jgi:hypothetical protein
MTKLDIVMEDWEIVGEPLTPYQAPECQQYRLRGIVTGHPLFNDGDRVTTSHIQDRNGRSVTTENTRYRLGYPSIDYSAYCMKNGYNIWKGGMIL